MRRVHGSARWRARLFLSHSRSGVRGPRNPDRRGHGVRPRRAAPTPAGIHRSRRPAVRLLHARAAHGRRRAASRESGSRARRDRALDDGKSLPVRHLPEDRRRDTRRRRLERGQVSDSPVPARRPLPGHDSAPSSPGRFITTRVEVEGREEFKVVERPLVEPEPWDAGARLTIVGQPVPRADALAKVTGQARYTTDILRPGMLHAAILRAPIARGRLTSLDAATARRMPGVRDIIVCDDLPRIPAAGGPLLDPEIRYLGQPLAALCADTLEQARAGVAALAATFSSEEPVATGAAALAPG